jgi:hypothetical protein
MRGAVLYKLGMDSVKERIMRVHYGVSVFLVFRKGYDPPGRKAIDDAGGERCLGAMKWLANKV